MTIEQDNTAPDIHPDFNKLLQHFMPLIHEMLKEQNNFAPLAGVLTNEGEIEFIAASPDEGKDDMTHLIEKNAVEIMNKIKTMDIHGTVMAMDTQISTPENPDMKTDCVLVQMEHVETTPVNAFCPYERMDDGTIKFSKLFGTPGTPQFLTT